MLWLPVLTSALCLLLAPIAAHADGGLRRWEWLGPGNAGGIVRSLVIHPTNQPLRILAASPGGGIWLSTNSGASWNLTDGFLPNLVVSTLSQCDSNPNVVYAGTGESFANASQSPSFGRGAPGAGVYKSVDAGTTWTPLAATASWTNGGNRFVNWVAVHPTNENLVLAATDAGIQRSTNGGASWQSVRGSRVTELRWVTPGGLMVAGLAPTSAPETNTDLVCALYSTNSGLTWLNSTFEGTPGSTTLTAASVAGTDTIQVASVQDFANTDYVTVGAGTNAEVRRVSGSANGLLSFSTNLSRPHSAGESVVLRISQRTSFAVTPGGARVYAAMGAGGGSIWRSTNFGRTFNFVNNPNSGDVVPPDNARDYLEGRAYYNNVIWAAPLQPSGNSADVVVVAGTHALRSTNSGASFERISDFNFFNEGRSAHSDIHAIVADPRFPAVPTVYFGNDGGVQAAVNILTVSKSVGWTNLAHGLGLSQFWAGKVTPDGQWFFGSGQDLGPVIRGPGDGINDWFLWTDSADSRNGAVESNPPGGSPFHFYNVTSNLQLITNNLAGAGITLEAPTNDACGDGFTSVYRAVELDPNNPAILVAAGKALWRSTSRAAPNSWTIIRNSLDCTNNDVTLCNTIAIAKGNSNLIWAGYNNGLLSHTVNSVLVWQDVSVPGGLPDCGGSNNIFNGAISDILIDPNNPQRVFVTFVGNRYDFRLTCSQTVFVTTNGGACWTPLMGNPPHTLPPTVATAIAMHPSRPNWLYVATDKGVYASEDSGQTWCRTPIFPGHEGPYNVMVRDLSWHDPDFLVAATYGLGMHRARTPATVYVDGTYIGTEELGTSPKPFNTVREGVNLIGHGASMSIRTGTYDETGVVQFDKRGYIRATGGTVTIR